MPKSKVCSSCGEEDTRGKMIDGEFVCNSCILESALEDPGESFCNSDSGRYCNCEDWPCCGHN